MLIDIFFFGCPLVLGICLAVHAVREQNKQFWQPALSFFAYCIFYLMGGREVLLYLLLGCMIGGGWAGSGMAGAH